MSSLTGHCCAKQQTLVADVPAASKKKAMCDLTNPRSRQDNPRAWQADEQAELDDERERQAQADSEAELWDLALHAEAMRELAEDHTP